MKLRLLNLSKIISAQQTIRGDTKVRILPGNKIYETFQYYWVSIEKCRLKESILISQPLSDVTNIWTDQHLIF
jgi:hypothetical protein